MKLLLWSLFPCIGIHAFTPTPALSISNMVVPAEMISCSGRHFQHYHKMPSSLFSTLPMPPPSWRPNQSPLKQVRNKIRTTMSKVRNNEALQWRVAASAFLSAIFLGHHQIDTHLARLWIHLTQHPTSIAARIFRTDSYEWVLAISSFAVFIHAFGYADRAVRRAAEQEKAHPWRKYRLQDRFMADQQRRKSWKNHRSWTLAEDKAEKSMTAEKEENDLHVQHTTWNWKAWTFEFWIYALPLLTWDILNPRRHRRLAAFAAPTTGRIVRDVAAGLLLYDFLFFCGHWCMHKFPFLYKTVHAKHHQVPEVRAGDIVRLSLPEEVLEVGFSIVALNLLSAHPMARSIYNVIIVFLLTELHCGFDFPWTPQNVIPFGLATGSRRHHYHHRFGRHYYQKFFCHVDRLFGHFQRDDGTLEGDSVQADAYVPASWK